jgi:precorrin-6B methylase 2
LELELQVLEVLRKVGIRQGQLVLDFGCGSGTYTIPAAKIVGEQGRVYALDKDGKTLDELMQKAKSAGLKNIERIDTSGELKFGLADESIDSILLFDVFIITIFPRWLKGEDYWRKFIGF